MATEVETASANDETVRGLWALLSAFAIWGVNPLYLRLMHDVSPLEIMAYRLVFSCVFVLGVLRLRGEIGLVHAALANPSVRKRLFVSALMVSTNWFLFTWAVDEHRVIEASLGYFINPLVNVLLGVVVLGERLRRVQWLCVALAFLGVAYLGVMNGSLPWLALALAFSFATYGLLRKTVAVDAMSGLAAETLLILPFGVLYLVYCEVTSTGALTHASFGKAALLVSCGPVTAIPLWLFSYGARRIAYSTVGLVQYIGPTLQLLIGIFFMNEPFSSARAVGFSFIWLGLAIYATDSLLTQQRARRSRVSVVRAQ